MHVPRIGQRNDTLLHQISQILDRRTWTTATATSTSTRHAAAGADRWQEQARGRQGGADCGRGRGRSGRVGVQALGVPFARGGRCGHCGDGCRRTRDRA
jgi:hypothetical protein